MNKKTNVLIITLLLLSVVALTVGVTFAFFSYAKEGTKDNVITTKSIEFLYTEVDKVGAGIAIEEAYPVTDDVGKSQTGAGKVFNFKVTSSINDTIDIPYTVTARKKTSDNSLSDEAVRIYLTEVSATSEKQLLLDNYNALDDYTNRPAGTTEKIIYSGLVSTGSTNYEKNFRLRMWIDKDVKFSPIENEDGTITYPYNDKKFTITVNVYANAKVVTESEVDMANTTKIENIIVNDPEVQAEVAPEEESYDYIANVENGVSNVSLEIETTNPEATVEVTKLDNTTAYISNMQRLSTTQTVSFDLVEGDNLFNIKILSANKQVENEYVLNIFRQPPSYEATYEEIEATANYTTEKTAITCTLGTPVYSNSGYWYYPCGDCTTGCSSSDPFKCMGLSGDSYAGGQRSCTKTTEVFSHYSCDEGYTLNESMCYRYTCPDGGTVEGTMCIK